MFIASKNLFVFHRFFYYSMRYSQQSKENKGNNLTMDYIVFDRFSIFVLLDVGHWQHQWNKLRWRAMLVLLYCPETSNSLYYLNIVIDWWPIRIDLWNTKMFITIFSNRKSSEWLRLHVSYKLHLESRYSVQCRMIPFNRLRLNGMHPFAIECCILCKSFTTTFCDSEIVLRLLVYVKFSHRTCIQLLSWQSQNKPKKLQIFPNE